MRGRIQRNCRGARASGCDGARQQGPLGSACADAGEGREAGSGRPSEVTADTFKAFSPLANAHKLDCAAQPVTGCDGARQRAAELWSAR